jgi:hypothetical protein
MGRPLFGGRYLPLDPHARRLLHMLPLGGSADRSCASVNDRRQGLVGVPAAYTCHTGMIHLFYAMPAVIPHGRTAMKRIGAEIRAMLQQ